MKPETTRVQIELPNKAMTRLKELKEFTEAGSYVEVIKQAISLYERMIKLSEAGSTIIVTDKAGGKKQLEIIY